MEEIVVVLVVVLFGGGALLVGLIFAITTGSARSERLRRLEQEQARQAKALLEAMGRVVYLERMLGDAVRRLAEPRPPPAPELAKQDPVPAAAPEPEPKPEPVEYPVLVDAAPSAPAVAAESPAPESPPPLEAPAPPLEPLDAPAIAARADLPAAAPELVAAMPEPQAEAPGAAPAAPPKIEPTAPPPVRATPAPEAPVRFDWERWVGVRGAAALGACVLVIAGLYFFKYSIENDLLSPAMRVVLGVGVGLGAVASSELRLRRQHVVLANWLDGAGVAILYTASWFAHRLGLVPGPVAFASMIAVTAACGALAIRNDAMVIALLGLVGGFATPVALSTGEDHPFGLFGYLLLLDGALLYLAQKKRWPILGALSLLGTALYQAAWIGLSMGPERLALGMGILVVFGAAYAVASPAAAKDEGELPGITRAGAVLVPFAFGLYFSLRADLGDRLYPLAAMLAVLCAGAAWMGRARRVTWASTAAAIAATTIAGVWLAVHAHAAIPWEAALCPAAIAAVLHAFLELEVWLPSRTASPGKRARRSAARAAAVASLGTLACLVAAASAPSALDPWPSIAAWLLLGALAVRQSLLSGSAGQRLALGVLVAVGFVAVHATHADVAAFPAGRVFLAALLAMTALGLLSDGLARRERRAADELAALVPLGAAVYFAAFVPAPHLAPLGAMLIALAAGATWAASAREESGWLAAAAASMGLGVIAIWLARHDAGPVAVEAALVVCVFAAVAPGIVEVASRRREPPSVWVERTAGLLPIAAIALLAGAASTVTVAPWPFVVGWTALSAVALHTVARPGLEGLHVALAVVLGLAFPVVASARAGGAAFPRHAVWLALALATTLAFLAAGARRLEDRAMRWANHGAATLALLLLLCAEPGAGAVANPWVVYGATLGLALVAQVVAARLAVGGWSFAAVLACALIQTLWTYTHLVYSPWTPDTAAAARTILALQALAVLTMTAWPVFWGRRFSASRWAWRAAALAGPFWFASLAGAWNEAFGRSALGALPVALGLLTLAVSWQARFDEEARRSALVWLLGVTLAGVSVAVPIQLDKEWITVGWALEGVALLALWRRLDHAGLKYTALAHLAVAAVRLVGNPWLLEYHLRSGVPVLNWLAYAYWVPAACLLGAFYVLRELEADRARPWEEALYASGRPVFAVGSAAAAIVVFFVWINLTIFDAWSRGTRIEIVFERLPARDLTLSLAWAIYALVLLGVGMARRSAALRWASLALVIVTVGKVFLYDLSHLHDLYRVVSLVGLALSLILISLAYQRFVFGGARAAPAEDQ